MNGVEGLHVFVLIALRSAETRQAPEASKARGMLWSRHPGYARRAVPGDSPFLANNRLA